MYFPPAERVEATEELIEPELVLKLTRKEVQLVTDFKKFLSKIIGQGVELEV